MDNDVTDKNDEIPEKSLDNPELQSLRDENRRLYELVERLIASQESEQAHRKAIETELQQMKLSLVEYSSSAQTSDTPQSGTPNLLDDLQELMKDVGNGLQEKLSAKMDALEERVTALADVRIENPSQDGSNPEELANATWKMIAPLGEELERLSGQVAGLGERMDRPSAASSGDNDIVAESSNEASAALKALLEDMREAKDKLVTTAQDLVARDREEMRDVLETRLSDVGRSMDDLIARQDDAQSQTLTLLRGLVDSHVGRLTAEWASQFAGLKRSVDDLRLEQVSSLSGVGSGGNDPVDDIKVEISSGSDDGAEKASENVVAGDFPAFQHATDDSGDKTTASVKETAMSADLRREMQAMEVLPETGEMQEQEETLKDADRMERSVAEDSELEDALLTEPADWRTEPDQEEDAIDLTANGAATKKQISSGKESHSGAGNEDAVDLGTTAGGDDRREIDLRAYKDLRLSCEPADAEDSPPKVSGPARGESYENRPAEASLTRFVRLIRARKRTTPS